ncbi:MAG: hypothetical protein ACON39_06490 [Coraliomargaritaceae bacterium]
MKHFVNLSLLFFFVTLVASGLLRFTQPFSLVVTRVHIIFGLGLVVLVGLHLSGRGKYFINLLKKPRSQKTNKKPTPRILLVSVLLFWGYLLSAALWNLWPVPAIISGSYEAKNARDIFRPHRQIAYEVLESGLNVARGTKTGAGLRIEFDWSSEFGKDLDKPTLWGDGHTQIAIWAEAEDGSVLETLFVTESTAASSEFEWGGATQKRNQVLPIWHQRYQDMIGDIIEVTDVVSSATPVRDFSLEGHLKMDGLPFVVYVEINAPKDSNRFFHSDQPDSGEGYMSPGIGQPSVIYEVQIYPSDEQRYYLMNLTGHSGSSRQNDGEIQYDTSQLTSSKKLVDKILLKVEWPEEKP